MKDIPKPNFIIIGSAKCGTTTLANILEKYADLFGITKDELSAVPDTVSYEFRKDK